MNKEIAEIIERELRCRINDYAHCADLRELEGNEESRVFFLECANEVKKALDVFLEDFS